jgi:hypothetical protein
MPREAEAFKPVRVRRAFTVAGDEGVSPRLDVAGFLISCGRAIFMEIGESTEIPPIVLLVDNEDEGRRVLAASHGLRERSTRLTTKARTLRERSDLLLQKEAPLEARPDDRRRNCPQCGGPLEWLERGTIGGVEYDYYRWCARACGLYCYDRTAGQFQKLA